MKLNTLHAQLDYALNGLRWLHDQQAEGWGGNCWSPLPVRFTDSVRPFFQFMVPYAVQETGPGRYVVLNRGYKPLGIMGESFSTPMIDYDDYAVDGPAELPNIPSVYEQHNGRWFFGDTTYPWENRKQLQAYMTRLETFIAALA